MGKDKNAKRSSSTKKKSSQQQQQQQRPLDEHVAKSIAPNKRTKGKKGKGFIVVNEDSVKIMRKKLADVGCKLHEVEGDGNCLFRALGDQLFGDQQVHETIRTRIVNYIQSKRDDFEPFMEDEEAFDQYCTRMRETGTWGGNQEIYAAARLFGVYVVIHQESTRMVIECDAQRPRRILHLAYHGSDHYDSVRSLQDPEDPTAPPKDIVLDVDGYRPEELEQRWRTKETPVAVAAHADAPATAPTTAPAAAAEDEAARALADLSITPAVPLSKKAQRLLRKSNQVKKARKTKGQARRTPSDPDVPSSPTDETVPEPTS